MNERSGRFSPFNDRSLFPVWIKPDSYWDVVVLHLPIVLLTGLGLFLPRWVSFRSLPFLKCTFLYATGYPCPFCGFTRSIWLISAGDGHLAAQNCPLSLGIYVLMAIFFSWHATALILGIRLKSGLYRLSKSGYTWWVIGAMFFLNWVYRISLGLL